MEEVVLRVRLVSGDSMDVTYEHREAASKTAVVDHVIATLSDAYGLLLCRHGDRLLVLSARGVAALEVAPEGQSGEGHPSGSPALPAPGHCPFTAEVRCGPSS